MKYVKFTEENDWEGETWNRFVVLDDTCRRLMAVIDKAEEAGLDQEILGLSYSGKEYSEEAVENAVLEEGTATYMSEYDTASISKKELERIEKIDFGKVAAKINKTGKGYDEGNINYKMSIFKR